MTNIALGWHKEWVPRTARISRALLLDIWIRASWWQWKHCSGSHIVAPSRNCYENVKMGAQWLWSTRHNCQVSANFLTAKPTKTNLYNNKNLFHCTSRLVPHCAIFSSLAQLPCNKKLQLSLFIEHSHLRAPSLHASSLVFSTSSAWLSRRQCDAAGKAQLPWRFFSLQSNIATSCSDASP